MVEMAKDLTKLTWPELEEQAPAMALRLASGARCSACDAGQVLLESEDNAFLLPGKAYEAVERVHSVMEEQRTGRVVTCEQVLQYLDRAADVAALEFGRPVNGRTRVLFVNLDGQQRTGSTFYRIMQPARTLQERSAQIWAEVCNGYQHHVALWYDVVVFPRACGVGHLAAISALRRAGRRVVYETDDALDLVLPSSPAYGLADPELCRRRKALRDRADAAIVSTPELVEHLQHREAHVCRNWVDRELWPDAGSPPSGKHDALRILWAGSATHEADLALMQPVAKALERVYGRRLTWCFIGAAPTWAHQMVRDGQATYTPAVEIARYPSLLAAQQAHVAVAPLVDVPFNRCKSELKPLEMWALGLPCVCSDVAPYRRCVEDQDRLPPDHAKWARRLVQLLNDPAERQRTVDAGRRAMDERYSAATSVAEYEAALLRPKEAA